MRIPVLGAGAQLQERGLIVKTQEGEIRRPARTVLAGGIRDAYDAVLLTCKAYDLDDAIDAIAPAVAGDCVVVPVLNGVRHIDVLTERFSQPDSTYRPSILVDMENGRTTEGEHTIGDLVDRANKHGVFVPILTAARTNLQVYEAGRIKP